MKMINPDNGRAGRFTDLIALFDLLSPSIDLERWMSALFVVDRAIDDSSGIGGMYSSSESSTSSMNILSRSKKSNNWSADARSSTFPFCWDLCEPKIRSLHMVRIFALFLSNTQFQPMLDIHVIGLQSQLFRKRANRLGWHRLM